MDRKIRILIVDDHDIVVRGIVHIISDLFSAGEVITDTANRGCKALEMAARQDYDLCMLDIEMPDIDGLGMLKIMRTEHPSIRIIVNTIHDELWYVKDYIRAGVEGILFKSVSADEIKDAIVRVLEGSNYYCSRARSIVKIIEGYTAPTPKEIEVLRHLAAGKNTEDIARFMGVSINTIESHRRHLLSKLEARNVAELIMNAVSQGLLSVSK